VESYQDRPKFTRKLTTFYEKLSFLYVIWLVSNHIWW